MIYINIPVLFCKQIFCLHASLLISGEGACPETNQGSRRGKKTLKDKAEVCHLLSRQQSKIALKALDCATAFALLPAQQLKGKERVFTLNQIIYAL